MPNRQTNWIIIDGAHGEGGGQILRTALSLSAITHRPFRIECIRALRSNPGLAAQHLTAVRSAAALCSAHLYGETLGSSSLAFHPTARAAAEDYFFDVSLAREGGSAGAVPLVLQTILPPLAFVTGDSPSFDPHYDASAARGFTGSRPQTSAVPREREDRLFRRRSSDGNRDSRSRLPQHSGGATGTARTRCAGSRRRRAHPHRGTGGNAVIDDDRGAPSAWAISKPTATAPRGGAKTTGVLSLNGASLGANWRPAAARSANFMPQPP